MTESIRHGVLGATLARDAANADPLPRPAYLRAQPHAGALVWSEHCYLLCIALALALAAMPPEWTFPAERLLRHLPLLATIPIVMLSVLGRRLSAPTLSEHPGRLTLSVLAPLLLLGLWIAVGSSHARWVENWQSTFLNLGLYMFAAAGAALMVASSRAPTRLTRAYFRLLIATGVIMVFGLLLVYGERELYHEQIFIVIPIAVACAIAPRYSTHAWAATLFFLAAAVWSRKNTSYLVALLTALYIAYFVWFTRIERAPSLRRLWVNYLAVIGIAAIAVVTCYLLYFRQEYLPSGNVEFRTFTYGAAWRQFTESPLWGTSFSAESIRKFTLYTVGIARNRLPTHSDIMDLLANGGLLAIGLWLLGYLRAGVFAYRRLLAPRFLHYPWAAQAHTFAMISIAAVVTYAFNPILLQPELAYLTWTTLGFLIGLAARCDPERNASDIARRFHGVTVPAQAGRSSPYDLAGVAPRRHA